MSDIVRRVDSHLRHLITTHRRERTVISAYLDVVYDEIEALVFNGGKRLRPQFCHWGWVAAGGDPAADRPSQLGAAVELVHVMALLHDDVIDDADTRRGAVTAHRRLAARHGEQSLAGEARRYGEGLAVLIGDITAVMADEMVGDLDPEARLVWNELRLEMNLGQFLDTIGSAHRDRSEQFARTVSRFKSAKYTIERPLHLGAMAADTGSGASLLGMLTGYGIPLGEAFQLRDDVLGAFGAEETVGKPVGGDFREGKPTPMLAVARERATGAQRAVLDMVGDPALDAPGIAAIQEVVVATGARDEMESRIDVLCVRALEALDESRLAGGSHAALVQLVAQVSNRQS
jgi:geranylgeranyl diphosphate synthase type I